MAISIHHRFVSGYADDTDATLVRPSNWNDDHNITGAEDQANKNQLSGYAGVDANGFVTPNGYAADTGTANTYAITLSPAPAALAAGQRVRFKVANANTAASTLNVNSLGAKSLVKSGSTALASGDLAAGQIVTAVYDGTNWQLQGVGGGSGGDLTAEYIIGASDVNLTNARVWPGLYNHPDAPPSSAGSLDDEFDDASFNTNAKWTWFNQGTAGSAVQNKSILALQSAKAASDVWRIIAQAAPSTPWEVTAKLGLTYAAPANFMSSGIVVYDSVSGRFTSFGPVYNNGWSLAIFNWTNFTTFSASAYLQLFPIVLFSYYRVKDDGTNLIFSISVDGANFVPIFTVGRTSFLTNGANKVGLGVDNNNAANQGQLSCDWFRRTL